MEKLCHFDLDDTTDSLTLAADLLDTVNVNTSQDYWLNLEHAINDTCIAISVVFKQHWATQLAPWAKVVNGMANASFACNFKIFLHIRIQANASAG